MTTREEAKAKREALIKKLMKEEDYGAYDEKNDQDDEEMPDIFDFPSTADEIKRLLKERAEAKAKK